MESELENEDERCLPVDLISNLADDWDTASSTQRSDQSVGSVSFKKYPWLQHYFDIQEEGTRVSIHCKGRDCTYKAVNRSSQRLIAHYNKCSKVDKTHPVKIDEEMDDINATRTRQWVKVMIQNNIPIKTVESDSFKEFVKTSCKPWRVPSRQEISNLYIPRLSSAVQRKFISEINCGNLSNLSIEFDGWKDKNHRAFLGVVATDFLGRKYLLDLRDISLRAHTAAVIVEELIEVLKRIPPKAINSIMSDSANNCKRAREDITLKPELKHIIHHRCLAHLFNLIGSKLTKKTERIAQLLNDSSVITNLTATNPHWVAHVRALGKKKIQATCQVRWYSVVNTLTCIADLKTVILEDILPTLTGDKSLVVANFDWVYLTEVLEILRPINECIGYLERKETSLGEAIHKILLYAKQLFTLTPSETVNSAKKAFLSYFNVKNLGREEFSLYLAAYLLDPRFKQAYVTDEGIYLAFEAMTRVAAKSGVKLKSIEQSLVDEFDTYRANANAFVSKDVPGEQVKWWRGRMLGGVLGPVGFRLAHLKSSSANIERTFSTVKYIQSGGKLNFLSSSLVDIARLKISFNNKREVYDWTEDFEESFLASTESEQTQDSSLDDLDSQTCPVESDLTAPPLHSVDGHSWIEEEDYQAKRDYQNFFQYYSFDIQPQAGCSRSSAPDEVTEDEIRDCVRVARSIREAKQNSLIIDSSSQMELDGDVYIVE